MAWNMNSGNNNNRRNKMARGKRAPAGRRGGRVGRAPARAMARGGRTRPRPAPRGRGRKMAIGGPGGRTKTSRVRPGGPDTRDQCIECANTPYPAFGNCIVGTTDPLNQCAAGQTCQYVQEGCGSPGLYGWLLHIQGNQWAPPYGCSLDWPVGTCCSEVCNGNGNGNGNGGNGNGGGPDFPPGSLPAQQLGRRRPGTGPYKPGRGKSGRIRPVVKGRAMARGGATQRGRGHKFQYGGSVGSSYCRKINSQNECLGNGCQWNFDGPNCH